MIDVVVIINFLLFLACCWWLARRYGRTLKQEMHDEQIRYKRLVEHKASLKKQVGLACNALAKQEIVYQDLSDKVQQWKENFDAQHEQMKNKYEKLRQQAQKKYEQQMQAHALYLLQKRVMRKSVQQIRDELKEKLSNDAAGVRYNDDCLQSLKKIRRLV